MDLTQAMNMVQLRRVKSAERSGEAQRDAITVARRVFTISAEIGEPYEGRKPEQWARQWLSSRKFVLMEIAPQEVAVPYVNRISGEKVRLTIAASIDSQVEPIVVDVNKQKIGKTVGGYVPRVIVVDGKHRHRAQVTMGKDRILAWVGELAAKELQLRQKAKKTFVVKACACEHAMEAKSKMESQAELIKGGMGGVHTLPGVRSNPGPGGLHTLPSVSSPTGSRGGAGISRTNETSSIRTHDQNRLEGNAGGSLGGGSGSNPLMKGQGARSSGQLKLDPSDKITSQDPSDKDEAEWDPNDPQMAAPGSGEDTAGGKGIGKDPGDREGEMAKSGALKADKEMDAGPIRVKKIVTDKKKRLAAVAPPGREAQVKKLKKKFGTESAFKIAWSQYNK